MMSPIFKRPANPLSLYLFKAAIVRLMISTAPLISLMGCSSAPAPAPVIVAETLTIVRPPLPAPIKLTRVHWRPCGEDVCVSIADAKAQIDNRIKVGRWMSTMNAAVQYYEGVTENSKATSSK